MLAGGWPAHVFGTACSESEWMGLQSPLHCTGSSVTCHDLIPLWAAWERSGLVAAQPLGKEGTWRFREVGGLPKVAEFPGNGYDTGLSFPRTLYLSSSGQDSAPSPWEGHFDFLTRYCFCRKLGS